MFLKLEGRQCLVVGAGKVSEPKIGGLLETGARIRVVALDASPAVRQWARAGRIELNLRAFSSDDLDGAFLAVVATSSRSLNERVYHEAQRRECCATWWMFPISATSSIPRWSVAAICRSQCPQLAKAPRWLSKYASSWKSNSARDTPTGWRSWARRESSSSPATSTRNASSTCSILSPAARPSRRLWPRHPTSSPVGSKSEGQSLSSRRWAG